MSHEQAARRSAASEDPAAPDERDAANERLERALAEERQKSAALRASVDGLQFQLDVLEKSYAKQLADARQRTDAAAAALAAREAELAELTERHAQAQTELTHALHELERSGPAAAKPRAPLGPRGAASRQPALHAQMPTNEGTINALLSDAPWQQEPRQARDDGQAAARVRPADTPAEEMLAPELVFTGGRDEDEER